MLAAAAAAGTAGLLAACTLGTPAPDGTTAPTGTPLRLAVIGDDLPYNAPELCDRCTGFADLYAQSITDVTGRPVLVENYSEKAGASATGMASVLGFAPAGLTDAIEKADVLLVSLGDQELPPFYTEMDGCPPPADTFTTPQEAVAIAAATARTCVDAQLARSRTGLASVLRQVRDLNPDAALGVLTHYNIAIGYPAVEEADAATAAAALDVVGYAVSSWNAATCEEAAAVGATCVDLVPSFNGPDGTGDAALLADDHLHPNQDGHSEIAALLASSGLLALDGK
ncbi:SGNH/GDSL hydrolase family protein [Leifsonia sp. F6_8S_P_1B]|uniref:SGNH/GDSL hydrolase family protein n=1 Tax=Leifsonia williamsii TaxID=3035919 RepID=A0ABT8KCN7_9MICO|nr:SGNH/GDSL hydrolase family protein [Leifsonia williamsii]MDN4614937.1 SGNH/GDSL hydrolase family protein [Leifsonia williamsii]